MHHPSPVIYGIAAWIFAAGLTLITMSQLHDDRLLIPWSAWFIVVPIGMLISSRLVVWANQQRRVHFLQAYTAINCIVAGILLIAGCAVEAILGR